MLTYLTSGRDLLRLAVKGKAQGGGVIFADPAFDSTGPGAKSEGSRGARKVSLRATDGRVDVSVIARAGGGGGHRQAAGFTTAMSEEDLVVFLREQVAAQL